MGDADLAEAVTRTSRLLIDASRSNETDGPAVASEVGRDADDMDVYYAFQEAERRGDLDCYWPGGMGLPSMVRLPRV